MGLVGRTDALNSADLLAEHRDILAKNRLEYEGLTQWVIQDCSAMWPSKKASSIWLHESSPVSYLWYALQRMNLLCELLNYQEQEELLEELLSGKWKKCMLARSPENMYN